MNASNPATSMSREEVSKLFLKRVDRRESGLRLIPVDQRADNSSREDFSTAVLGKPVKNIKAYWRKVVFSGLDEPPTEVASDAEVVTFVASNVGAIGYISAQAARGNEVKVLSIKD